MAIEIHIRVRESDWDFEYDIAKHFAEKIQELIPDNLNVPILILPVEDPEKEMKPLVKS